MENYKILVQNQKSFFRTNKTKDIGFRLDALQKLRNAIKKYEQELMDALKADLNKSEFDAYSTEIGFVLKEMGQT
jgi:aldehyde dehydrogenase (NAD+)